MAQPALSLVANTSDKLRIAVVGLLDRQAGIVISEFPDLDIRHSTADENKGTNNPFFRKCDKILFMTKFVGHDVYDTLDRSKVIHVNGGLTKLRKILSDILWDQTQAQEKRAAELPAVSEHEAANIKLGLMNDAVKSHNDSEKFKGAQTGDVIVFVANPGTPAALFQQLMFAKRSYWKRKHGILSEQKISGNRCEITIVKSFAEAFIPVAPVVTVADPAADVVPEAAPAAVPDAMAQEFARNFWQSVFLKSLSLSPSAPVAVHVTCANTAVDSLLSLFKGN